MAFIGQLEKILEMQLTAQCWQSCKKEIIQRFSLCSGALAQLLVSYGFIASCCSHFSNATSLNSEKKMHQIVCSTADNTLLLILYLYPGPILGSKSSYSPRINICNSQRLYSISTDKKNSWLEPKFPTECFFMAIEAHHLALLPACRRHSRRQRAHRDLTRMIEHLESHESEWMETPMASRNKSLLKKWREQIKVLPGFVF